MKTEVEVRGPYEPATVRLESLYAGDLFYTVPGGPILMTSDCLDADNDIVCIDLAGCCKEWVAAGNYIYPAPPGTVVTLTVKE